MTRLAPVVLGRAYCEPGKLSWLATQCLLVLRESSPSEALQCATSLDEDLLEQMTPRGQKFTTRLHLVLRSPWPAFRLLDLLVRLHPESGSTRMGACRKNMKWNSDPDVFDWPTFKPTVIAAVNGLAADEVRWFHLSPEDGPLSRQYRARWLRIHNFPPMKEAISFSDDVFDAYREHHYRAGCHLGVISSYALQVLLVNLRDVEGRMQRYCASVANLVNIHAPFHQTAKTDWPLFRLLHFVSLLQRAEPWTVWKGMSEDEPSAGQDAARRLVADVEKAVLAKASASASAEVPMAFLTSAWGWQADHLGHVLDRWTALFAEAPLVVLARDSHAIAQCEQSASSKRALKALRCVDSPMRLGVESMVAKYLSLAALTRLGLTAVWLDLDVFVAAKPFDPWLCLAVVAVVVVVFAVVWLLPSVSPAVVVARGGSASAVSLLLGYARWLRENPFLLDHQGIWTTGPETSLAASTLICFDYKGRNVTAT
ncbi:unnamed protein product [Polarella glacialis]|uniref:Uncharacterized protein n=1 Tax=Polarella glacialis TaxID=89957 RepID=A0A813H4Z2_POLGL|nr:unnamed protein product [Polarella glacialis]